MKYAEQRQLAVAWLNSARNRDSGWGLNPKLALSIVNTAEAAYVLGKLSALPQDVQKTVQFLRQALTDHPTGRGFFTRYFAFGIVGLLSLGVDRSDSSIQICAQALRQGQINSKSWSQLLHDQPPHVFPTFLALWTLQMVEEHLGPQTLNGLNWLLTIPIGYFQKLFDTQTGGRRQSSLHVTHYLCTFHKGGVAGRQTVWDKGQRNHILYPERSAMPLPMICAYDCVQQDLMSSRDLFSRPQSQDVVIVLLGVCCVNRLAPSLDGNAAWPTGAVSAASAVCLPELHGMLNR